jgi:5-amino-6-(5-phosphoribosylamino)uracil reductase
VRQLLPDVVADRSPAELYTAVARPAPPERPWVAVNMIVSADGATAVDGVSGALGGPADKAVFAALRAAADVVLVGAGTARAEGYGPARARPDGSPGPRIAVVTRSGALDPGARLFTGGSPLVITCEDCPAERRAELAGVAEVVLAGSTDVDPGRAVGALRERGAAVVLCEGGASLNGQLVAADLVDEWCLTLAPALVAGASSRAAVGPSPATGATDLRLAHLAEADGFLFARYLR